MTETERYQRAKTQVQEQKDFWVHLAVFVPVNAGLVALNLVKEPEKLWVHWVHWVHLGHWGHWVLMGSYGLGRRDSAACFQGVRRWGRQRLGGAKDQRDCEAGR